MSAVPELKQKKIARDQAFEVVAKAAAEKATKDAAEFEKAIFERAKAYEAEYEQVNSANFNFIDRLINIFISNVYL